MKAYYGVIKTKISAITPVTAVLAGLLLGVGFILPMLWFLVLFGIVWSVRAVKRSVSYTQAAWWMSIVFTTKALSSMVWLWYVYPINWIDSSGPTTQIIFILFYWCTGALWLGVGGICVAVAARYFYTRRACPTCIWYLVFPGIWLLAEIGGAYFFSLMAIGPGSVIQSYFSFGFIGYVLGTTPAGIFLAAWGGAYGLTVILVYLGLVLEYITRQSYYKWGVTGLSSLVILLSVTGLGSQTLAIPSQTPIRMVIINTTFDNVFLATEAGQLQKQVLLSEAITAAVALQPGYILLPEDSRYLESINMEQNPYEAMAYFQFTHQNTKAVLIDSGRLDVSPTLSFLRATVFDGRSKSVYQVDKQYLVPQGEYVPTLYRTLLTLLGIGNAIDNIALNSSFQPGPLRESEAIPTYVPGILFCFESIRPDAVTGMVRDRALPFVAHPISHAKFHTPVILWQQLDTMLQIQARSAGVPIVSAGNMAAGKLYLPNGTVLKGVVVGRGERWELRSFEF